MTSTASLLPSTEALVTAVVEAAKDHLSTDISFFAKFQDDKKVFEGVSHRLGSCPIAGGESMPKRDSYCHRLISGNISNLINDAKSHREVKDLPITKALNIGGYIGVPVILQDGEVYGTLCCITHQPAHMNEQDVRFLSVLADILSAHITRQKGLTEDQLLKRKRIERVLTLEMPHMVYQPIVDITRGTIVGAEALARFSSEPTRGPDKWFEEAWETGNGIELEVCAMKLALAQREQLPAPAYLTLNLSPETLLSEQLAELTQSINLERIVFEITEHEVIADHLPLRSAMDRLRGCGARIAIDDVGAGYSGLNRILELRPDVLKLDLQLSGNIHVDPAKQAMVSAVASFAVQTGASVVAEGIETAAEMETLRSLGVPYGQGYFFAKPGPMPMQLNGVPLGRSV